MWESHHTYIAPKGRPRLSGCVCYFIDLHIRQCSCIGYWPAILASALASSCYPPNLTQSAAVTAAATSANLLSQRRSRP